MLAQQGLKVRRNALSFVLCSHACMVGYVQEFIARNKRRGAGNELTQKRKGLFIHVCKPPP